MADWDFGGGIDRPEVTSGVPFITPDLAGVMLEYITRDNRYITRKVDGVPFYFAYTDHLDPDCFCIQFINQNLLL